MRFLRHLGVLLKEFSQFAWLHKPWWIIPIVLALLLLALLVFAGGTVAPFLYPMV